MGFELTGATPDERLKELTEKLEQGVSEIFTSGRYAEYLSAMSKFHTYSFGNVMLILMQNPAASCVAGFHTWKKEFGRNVKAHESGLKILAPCPYRRFIEQDKLDKDGKPVLDAAGKPLSAIVGAASWVLEPSAYGKAGLAIDRAWNDYYDLNRIFPNIRKAIDIMNPVPEN